MAGSGGAGQFAGGEQFDHQFEDFALVLAVEGEGELGVEQAIARADVVAASVGFEGEVAFALGEAGEGGGEGERTVRTGVLVEEVEDGGGKDVHAEEAEVLAGAKAWDEEALLGFGGGGLFEHVGDVVVAGVARGAAPADRAIVGELRFVGRLDRGDRAGVGSGDLDQLAGAADAVGRDVEVVADQEEEGVVAGEIAGGEDGVAEAAGVGLFEEMKFGGVGAGGGGEGVAVAGGDDQGDFVDAGGEGFLDEDGKGGLRNAVLVDDGLEGEGTLGTTGRGDDRLLDLHGRQASPLRGQRVNSGHGRPAFPAWVPEPRSGPPEAVNHHEAV